LSRLVIHAPNWLGDSIMARGFVAAALDCHDAQNAVIVAHRRVAPLWRAWPGLSVVESASGHWLSDAASTARRIRGLGAHACSYTLSASLRSALTLAWAGIPERIGFAWGGAFMASQSACIPLAVRYMPLFRRILQPPAREAGPYSHTASVELAFQYRIDPRAPACRFSMRARRLCGDRRGCIGCGQAIPGTVVASRAVHSSDRSTCGFDRHRRGHRFGPRCCLRPAV
jgi:hypothetical protein